MTRRSFLDFVVSVARFLVVVLSTLPIVRFLVAPLRSNSRATDFLPVLPLSAIGPGDTKRATVVSDRTDAFTHHPSGPIGSVWLVREDAGDADPQLRCFQATCPHLGCVVDQTASGFGCPCHGAVFDETGKRQDGPSPRDMDELEVRVKARDDGVPWIEVKYRTFASGTAEKTLVG